LRQLRAEIAADAARPDEDDPHVNAAQAFWMRVQASFNASVDVA
jgi:hypothetical protein